MKDMDTKYKTTMEFLVFAALGCGIMAAWSAMVGYNNGNINYAIYAAMQGVMFMCMAMVFAIMRATKRR
jgi:hypothetical protein